MFYFNHNGSQMNSKTFHKLDEQRKECEKKRSRTIRFFKKIGLLEINHRYFLVVVVIDAIHKSVILVSNAIWRVCLRGWGASCWTPTWLCSRLSRIQPFWLSFWNECRPWNTWCDSANNCETSELNQLCYLAFVC